MKKVTVALELDSEIISLLNTQVNLKSLHEKDDLTPIDMIGLLILMEARGSTEAHIHASTLHKYRPHITIKHELRQVVQGTEILRENVVDNLKDDINWLTSGWRDGTIVSLQTLKKIKRIRNKYIKEPITVRIASDLINIKGRTQE